jgi:hypothetical protein
MKLNVDEKYNLFDNLKTYPIVWFCEVDADMKFEE